MNLIVFDIDGTLTDSCQVDDRCYSVAIRTVLGISHIEQDWSTYTHCTDSGILWELHAKHFGSHPTFEDFERVQHCFFQLLDNELKASPPKVRPIAGAVSLLRQLSMSPDWKVAIATGGWRQSAVSKLRCAGLDLGFPMATSDDAMSREEIIDIARCRAGTHYNVAVFASTVYVGDGLWDLRAATRLGLGFVGRAMGSRARQLRHAGACNVIPDFVRRQRFLSMCRLAPTIREMSTRPDRGMSRLPVANA
jgi:phosphoglycolate phosphatase-like HAD superfamily hydrolase